MKEFERELGVKTVNGTAPDSNGNIDVDVTSKLKVVDELPETVDENKFYFIKE